MEALRLAINPEGAEKVSVMFPAKPRPPSPAKLTGVCAEAPVLTEMTVATGIIEKS